MSYRNFSITWDKLFPRFSVNNTQISLGRVGKRLVKFCHPLQVANFSMLLVQNSLQYFQQLKIKLILLILKHGVQRSHSQVCSLKKCTLPYNYFVVKCLVLYFGIKKRVVRKKV